MRTRHLLVMLLLLGACGSRQAPGDAGALTLSTDPGPWCGQDGTWKLTISLDAVTPFDYSMTINQQVLSCLPSCSCRWGADLASCAYAFEMVCASVDIRRTDQCQLKVDASKKQMSGTCTQTVETLKTGTKNVHPGKGSGVAL